MTVQSLARPLTLDSLAPASLQVIGALRLWALAARLRWCPVRAVAQQLGSLRAAAHLRLIIEEIGTAWPDPFCVAPPCSARLSHDEATVAHMLGQRPPRIRSVARRSPALRRARTPLSLLRGAEPRP